MPKFYFPWFNVFFCLLNGHSQLCSWWIERSFFMVIFHNCRNMFQEWWFNTNPVGENFSDLNFTILPTIFFEQIKVWCAPGFYCPHLVNYSAEQSSLSQIVHFIKTLSSKITWARARHTEFQLIWMITLYKKCIAREPKDPARKISAHWENWTLVIWFTRPLIYHWAKQAL